MDALTHHKLVHAVTEYDRKQSTKRFYNRYALGQYLERIADIELDVANGADLRAAIVAGFCGRLADVVLRAVALPVTTKEEKYGSGIYHSVSGK